MRRMMFCLFAFSFLVSLAGCMHAHGVCDCEHDNHCADRAPWVQYAHPSTPPAEILTAPPAKLPEGTKKDL